MDSGKSENGEVEKGLMKPCLEPSSIIGDVKAVVLDFKGVIFVDVVGVKAVRQVFTDYENIGLNVYLTHCNDNVFSILRETDFLKEKGDFVFLTTRSVLKFLEDEMTEL